MSSVVQPSPANDKALPLYVGNSTGSDPKATKKIIKDWNMSLPPDLFQPLTLLTIMGIAVTALWQGEYGEHYIAWVYPDSIALCGQLH